MHAVVFEQFRTFPVLTEVEKPVPGPGEVLLKVAGAGACHSDVAVYREFQEGQPGAQAPGSSSGTRPPGGSRPSVTG